jgi:hypothetical protein
VPAVLDIQIDVARIIRATGVGAEHVDLRNQTHHRVIMGAADDRQHGLDKPGRLVTLHHPHATPARAEPV